MVRQIADRSGKNERSSYYQTSYFLAEPTFRQTFGTRFSPYVRAESSFVATLSLAIDTVAVEDRNSFTKPDRH